MGIYILQGVGLGFSAAVLPGPFLAYLISQTLSRGWKRTLPAAFAPLVSDGPIIALCLFILSQVPARFERTLHFAGGAFILYLAYGAFRAWRDFDPGITAADAGIQGNVFKAALMNILSPGPYIYWSLVTGPILIRGWRETPVHGIVFLAGFYVTIVLSLAAIILVFGLARQLGPNVNRALIGVSALALFFFGVYQLWLGAGYTFP
jgi:threonine/homoserine/homoserine lactone efflux protein